MFIGSRGQGMASACFFVCVFWRSYKKVWLVKCFEEHEVIPYNFFIGKVGCLILTFFTEMTSIKRNVTSLEALSVIFSVFKQIFRALWCGYIIKCQMNLFFYRLHANLHVLCQTLISVMLNTFLVWVSILHFFISLFFNVFFAM